MSEFRSLPQNFSASQDDEFLLVTPTTSTRASVKSLFWDNYALLKFRHPGDQDYGIGQADTWAQLPFNTLDNSGPDPWVTLNPDGSFLLNAGLYSVTAGVVILAGDRHRFGLFRDAQLIEVSGSFTAFGSVASTMGTIKARVTLAGQATLSLAVATQQVRVNALQSGDTFLAGQQSTIAACEIFKLG